MALNGFYSKEGEMAIAIAAGVCAGIVGFLPLFAALRLARRSASTSAMSAGLYGLGGTFVSLIIVAVALIVCAVVSRESVLAFGLAEMLALIVSTAVYVVYKNILAKRKK